MGSGTKPSNSTCCAVPICMKSQKEFLHSLHAAAAGSRYCNSVTRHKTSSLNPPSTSADPLFSRGNLHLVILPRVQGVPQTEQVSPLHHT